MTLSCVICKDELNGSHNIYTTPCGHVFHYACLQPWLQNSKTCPHCRRKCSAQNIRRIYFDEDNEDDEDNDDDDVNTQPPQQQQHVDTLQKAIQAINMLRRENQELQAKINRQQQQHNENRAINQLRRECQELQTRVNYLSGSALDDSSVKSRKGENQKEIRTKSMAFKEFGDFSDSDLLICTHLALGPASIDFLLIVK